MKRIDLADPTSDLMGSWKVANMATSPLSLVHGRQNQYIPLA